MQKKREHAKARWTRAALKAGGAVAVCALFTLALPPGADAGDDFERGFKRELGAIAAHEVVGVGRHILGGVVTGQHGHGYRQRGYPGRYHYRSNYARLYRAQRTRYQSDRSYRSHRHYRPVRRWRHEHRHDRYGSCNH